MTPHPWLTVARTVRFGDTDGAGVMHFHQLLRWCHEAYEESLERFGIPGSGIFPGAGPVPAVALPIVHCEADYRRPLHCGQRIDLELRPLQLDPGCFEVTYVIRSASREAARARTRHRAILTQNRRRCPLPDPVHRWLEASLTP
jgi:1,4-dihydroxy-2-naphthoyl-CoA hydrolase